MHFFAKIVFFLCCKLIKESGIDNYPKFLAQFFVQELQQDISKRAPVVVRINTTGNQLIDRTKQGSPALLKENLKKLNSDWNRLKTKVAQRQHEFKQTQLEMEQFHVLIERDYKLIGELDRVVEKSYHVLEGTETELEEALRVRQVYFKVLKL